MNDLCRKTIWNFGLIPYMERMRSTDSFEMYSPGAQWVPSVSSRMDPAEAAPMLAKALERAEHPDVRHQLAQSLASVAGRLEAAEDARICRQAARFLIAALGRETNVDACSLLVDDVVSVAGRLDKTEAAQICGQAAQVLAVALPRETDANARSVLASALSRVSARLNPAEATRTCGPAARMLADAMEREMNASARSSLAGSVVCLAGLMDQSEVSNALVTALARQSEVSNALVTALVRDTNNNLRNRLASLAGRSDPAEAARIYGQAALVLAAALEHEKDFNERNTLALGLASLAGRLDSAEATRICGQATRSLADALARETNAQIGPGMGMRSIGPGLSSLAARMAPAETARALAAALKQGSNPSGLTALARILSATADRLDDAEAHRICDQLIETLDRDSFRTIAPEVIQQLNPERAHALAWDLASEMCSEPGFNTDTFSRVLTDTGREQKARRRAARRASAGPGLEGWLEATFRIMSADPFPCRLTTQELVELLKMPTCFGAARRIVLDHLGTRYGRRFVNHWAFVRFATEQKLGLDFTTPPKRPDRKESLKRTLGILDEPAAER